MEIKAGNDRKSVRIVSVANSFKYIYLKFGRGKRKKPPIDRLFDLRLQIQGLPPPPHTHTHTRARAHLVR